MCKAMLQSHMHPDKRVHEKRLGMFQASETHLLPQAREETEGLSAQEADEEDGLCLEDMEGRGEEVEDACHELLVFHQLSPDPRLKTVVPDSKAAQRRRGSGT